MDKLTSGPGSYILPMLVGAGSVLSPRLAAGASTAIGMMDFFQRGRKEQKREQGTKSVAEMLAKNPEVTMGISPEGLAQNPQALSAALERQSKLTMPTQHPGTIDRQHGVFTIPGAGQEGAQPKWTPMGPQGTPNFNPAQTEASMRQFGVTPEKLTQEQWGQIHEASKQEQYDKEERQLGTYFTKINETNANSQQRLEYGKAVGDWGNLRSQHRLNEAALLRKQQKQLTDLKLLPPSRQAVEKPKLDTWFLQQRSALDQDFLLQAEDWQGAYGALNIPGYGGNSKYLESIKTRSTGAPVAPAGEQKQYWLR